MVKSSVEQSNVLISIDISKDKHAVLLKLPDGKRKDLGSCWYFWSDGMLQIGIESLFRI